MELFKKPQQLATQYNIDAETWTEQTAIRDWDPSQAQQQFKDECDINVLMGRYLETGEMPQVQERLAYGNFEGIFDFTTAMNVVRTAQEAFLELPARIKNRFDNDPQKLVTFLNDPENADEARFLGLLPKLDQPQVDSAARAAPPTGADGKPVAVPPETVPASNPAGASPAAKQQN